MREYKFRGKTLDEGDWVCGDLINCGSGGVLIFPRNGFFACETNKTDGSRALELTLIEVDPNTIGQYTGLEDKNGKEIYEGDIVRTADGNVVATIKIGECYPEPVKKFCEFHGIKNHKVYCLHAYDKVGEYLIEDNKSLEIIGNIYDNPDLREEKND